MTLLKQYISNRTGEFTLFGLIVLSFSIMSILMPDRFLTTDNIGNMMFQSAELGILSLAMAITLIIGGIDLSVVAMANLTAIILCYVLKWLTPASMVMPASLMIILFTGLFWGGINGLLVTKIKLPPILATLGTMTLYAGIGIGLTNGSTITGIPDMLQHIGSGTFFYLPIPIYFTIFCFIVVGWIMNHTPLGFKLVLLGNSETVAAYSGYNNNNLKFFTYTLSGVLSALAGFIILCRTNAAYADYGKSYITLIILIVIMGGVSITGGRGSVIGIALALLAMQIFSTGFNMLLLPYGNSNFFKDFLYGALLIIILSPWIVDAVKRLGRKK